MGTRVRATERRARRSAAKRGTGTYNAFYREFGTRTVKTLRTSIITDPPDGRIPALTPAAAEVKRRRLEASRVREPRRSRASGSVPGVSDRRAADAAVFLQQQLPDRADRRAVLVHAEMIHDARIIHLDGRPHPAGEYQALARVTRLGAGKATRWSSTPRISTTAAASMATPAATSAGTAICTLSSASVSSTPIRCCISSRSTIRPRSRGHGKAN